jgi:hypothetical protein
MLHKTKHKDKKNNYFENVLHATYVRKCGKYQAAAI